MYFHTYTYRKIIRIQKRWLINWLKYPFIDKQKKHHKALKKYRFSRNTGPSFTVCHAPERSIYFGFGGKVVPCCFNREYIYGIYPEQTVTQIIHGEKRKALQKALENQDFSLGCKHCLELINAGNYEGVEARLYDGLKTNKNWYPSEMIFELDNTCNLECIMCEGAFSSSILKNREKKTYKPGPYDDEFVRQIIPYFKHLEVAKFMGGEPFLINLHYKIWDAILEINPRCVINLQTNGTVFNKKIESLLKRGHFQIGVSIDSLDKKTFEEIRQNAVFEEVMENLDKFIAAGKKSGHYINVSICPMQQNRHEIPELISFCNHKKVFVYFNTVYSKGFDLRELPVSELEQLLNKYKKALHKLPGNNILQRRNRKFFKSLTSQIYAWYREKKTEQDKYMKTKKISCDDLYAMLAGKISDNPPAHEKLVNIINNLPGSMMLSENQLQQLSGINDEDFIRELEHNDVDTLDYKLKYFIETQRFPES
ncbi:MAG: radical SAM protein [Bacteroidales bacterium]